MILPYLHILKRRNFFLLWMGQIISQFGDRLTQMALVGLVYKIKPLSSLNLAKIMSLAVIPVLIISPLAGVYVDRWRKQKTMYITDFLRGVLIFAIPILFFRYHMLGLIYTFIFLSFCLGRFFIPSKMAIIPLLVEKKDIFLANSLVSITAMIAAMLGLGIGGVVVEKLGIEVAFFIDSFTFILSALLIGFMNIKEKAVYSRDNIIKLGKEAISLVQRSLLKEIREGVEYILQSKKVRRVYNSFFLLFSFIGSLYVVFVVFIQETLSSITIDLGFISLGGGLGLFLGTLIYGRLGKKFNPQQVVNLSMSIASLYLIIFIVILRVYPSKVFALISCFFLGIMVSPIAVSINSIIHQESDNNFWGRIFSSLEIVSHLSFIIFMLITAYLADKILTPFTIIVSVGIISSCFSLFNLIRHNDTIRGEKRTSTSS